MSTPLRAAALCGLLALAPAAAAQTPAPPPAPGGPAPPPAAESMFRATTLNLAAYGETKVAPDQATVTVGVTTEAPTAQEAMRANTTQMNQVVAALRRGGIAERDIQTSSLNLHPQQVYRENQPPRITGYQASNQVTITVRDLARLGGTVDAVVEAGGNQVHGISFGLNDRTAAEDAARQDAVRALQAKAELYARATGHRIGRLVSLSESSSYHPVPPPMPMMAMAERAMAQDATSVSPGELNVRVNVSGLYELVR